MKAILAAICLALAIGTAQACSCFPERRRKLVCETGFIVVAKVQSRLINENGDQDFDDYYRIQVLSVIKMDNTTEIDMTRVYTGTTDGLCGVYLPRRTTYILGGKLEEGRMNINLCRSIYMPARRSGKIPKSISRPRCETLKN